MNAQHVPWDHLHFFLATAREGTLVAAAEVLGVNHSTVHRRIGALEEELEVRLFDRSQQGYSLTPAGEELLEHVLAIEREILAIGRKIVGRDQALEGRVRVETVGDLALELLLPIVREFRLEHPAVTVDLRIATDFADLTRMDTDIAIRFGSLPDEARVVGRKIAHTATVLSASTRYIDEHGRPESADDLADHFIIRGDDGMARLPNEKLLDQHTSTTKTALRSNSMLVRFEAVKKGLGVGFVPHFMAVNDPAVEILEWMPPGGADVWMLLHADVRSNARIRAFADFAYERLVAHRDIFEVRR